MQAETTQLIEYKIFLTFVMQGKEGIVDWILNKFEGAKDSPALYYANAAVAFQHRNQKEAKDWMSAANKQFSEPLNKLYRRIVLRSRLDEKAGRRVARRA